MVFGANGLSVGIGSADGIIDLSMLNGWDAPPCYLLQQQRVRREEVGKVDKLVSSPGKVTL